jgi:hypothetical protein
MENRIRIFFMMLMVLGYGLHGHAQTIAAEKEDRILLVVNGGFSMKDRWEDSLTRYEAATLFISRLSERMNEENAHIGFGLRLYGHQYKRAELNCMDTRKEVPYSKDNGAQLYLRLKDIEPKGHGSIKYTIEQALENDMPDTGTYRYSLVFLTDSITSCSGDPCILFPARFWKERFYKTFVVNLGTQIMQSCIENQMQLIEYKQVLPIVERIIKDFPSRKHPDNFKNGPLKQQAVEVTQGRKQKEIVEPAYIYKSKLMQGTGQTKISSVQIRSKSNITTDTLYYGFLNLINDYPSISMTLYKVNRGQVSDKSLQINPVNKTRLPIGSYELVFDKTGSGQRTIQFIIKRNMITDVRLK